MNDKLPAHLTGQGVLARNTEKGVSVFQIYTVRYARQQRLTIVNVADS